MLDAVFISDLHLHPEEAQILARFQQFITWAQHNTRAVYVLGDLFHVWAGDDCMETWSKAIAKQFYQLREHGIALYFMPGNRDFLLGESFATEAGFHMLKDPSLIKLHDKPILLAHGDAYCLSDKAHQRFRRLTRNQLFINIFLQIPAVWRKYLVKRVRNRSQGARADKLSPIWDVSSPALLKEMQHYQTDTLIHGHTHKPGLTKHCANNREYHQYVLSDWDDFPQILGYNKSIGLKFVQNFTD